VNAGACEYDFCTLAPGALGNAVARTADSFLQLGTRSLSKWRSEAPSSVGFAANRTRQQPNMCIDQHLVPELFIIGAQKSATTSLAVELTQGSSAIVTRTFGEGEWPSSWKEPHFFDWRYNEGRWSWLSGYPACPDYRAVAVDMTPMVHTTYVPARIVEWYGDLSAQLSLVLLLRDPLSRMHSAFYHEKECIQKPELLNIGFSQYSLRVLGNPGYCSARSFEGSFKDEDPFCDSLYADQLYEWFKYFKGTQFTIIPYKYQAGRNNDEYSIAESFYAKYGIPGKRMPVEHAYPRPHNTLEKDLVSLGDVSGNHKSATEKSRHHRTVAEDLEAGLHNKIESLLDGLSGAHVLANIFVTVAPRAYLYGFTGDRSDEGAVARWLANNW
jgi:hypothetical protein